MVQNTTDKVSTMDIVRDRHLWRQDRQQRCVPYLLLATPTVLHSLLVEALSSVTYRIGGKLFLHRTRKAVLTSAVGALWLDFSSRFLTEILLYPLETVLVRLFCQGMPALVDNIQNGVEQTFVASYYSGTVDCITGIYDSEGALGFFKGFSAVLIRYSVHGILLMLLWRTAQALDSRLTRSSSFHQSRRI